MENQSSSIRLTYLFLAHFFERMAYFGFKATIVLFLIKGGLSLNKEAAYDLYGTFITAIFVLMIIGGLLSDFVMPKVSVPLLGTAIFIIGIVLLAISSADYILICLIIIALGVSIYQPAMSSLVAMPNRQTPTKQDATFTLQILIINIGAAIGVVIIGYTGQRYGYDAAFAMIVLFSIFGSLILLLGQKKARLIDHTTDETKDSIYQYVGLLATMVILLVIYALPLELFSLYVDNAKAEYQTFSFVLESSAFFGLLLLFSILWLYVKISTHIKIIIGLALSVIGWLIYGYFIPSNLELNLLTFLVTAEIIFIISELFIVPMIHSLTAQKMPILDIWELVSQLY